MLNIDPIMRKSKNPNIFRRPKIIDRDQLPLRLSSINLSPKDNEIKYN